MRTAGVRWQALCDGTRQKFRGFARRMRSGEIARTLGLAMNVKPLYTRNRGGSLYDRGWYDVGDWRICGKHVLTENFTLDTMPCVLKSLEALGRRGFAPDGELALHFVPKHCNMEMGDERLYHSGRTARACGDGAGALKRKYALS